MREIQRDTTHQVWLQGKDKKQTASSTPPHTHTPATVYPIYSKTWGDHSRRVRRARVIVSPVSDTHTVMHKACVDRCLQDNVTGFLPQPSDTHISPFCRWRNEDSRRLPPDLIKCEPAASFKAIPCCCCCFSNRVSINTPSWPQIPNPSSSAS